MNKTTNLIILLCGLICCGPGQDKVEKIIEDGVEVVLNHIEPYKITGVPSVINLAEKFTIDTERDNLAELGIGTISTWEVNSYGDIYLVSRGQIFKFDKSGNFVKTVGQQGQGPGEHQIVIELRLTGSGVLSFYDNRNAKYLFFASDGTFKEEKKVTSDANIDWMIHLDNDNFMIKERQNEPEKGIRKFHYALLDNSFKKIVDLHPNHQIEIPNYQTNKFSLLPYSTNKGISTDKIFVSSNMGEYLEIEVYNFHGDLLRKVRKESDRLNISNEYKTGILNRWEKSPLWERYSFKDIYYFPDYFPPYKMFWVDDEERIFVETYEEGERAGESLFYIFNSDGIFISIKSLKEASSRRFKNNCLYCIYEKESGYQKVVVYDVNWN